MKRYLLTYEAREDLTDIKRYLTREAGGRVANSTLKRIRDAFIFLNRTPGMGHLREDLTNAPVKFWSVSSYLIIYNPAAQPIEIVRVLHGSREVEPLITRTDD